MVLFLGVSIDTEHRARIFKEFSPYLPALPQSYLYLLWLNILPPQIVSTPLELLSDNDKLLGTSLYEKPSSRTRPELLSDIAALMPMIHRLGGEKGVRDTFLAIQAVSAWWP